MPFRITSFGAYQQGVRQIRDLSVELSRSSEIISSGRNFLRPSDGPAEVSQALDYRRLLSDIEQYKRNSLSGQGALGAADSALDGAMDAVTRLRELAVTGASGTIGQGERDSLAAEVAGVREQLIASANAKYGDRYVFAGFASDRPAYTAAGVYQGDSGVSRVEVGEADRVTTGLPGDRIFGTAAGGVDVFAIAAQLETDLRAGDAAGVQSALGGLERASNQLAAQRAYLGAQMNRLQRADASLDEANLNISKLSSKLEDADMVSAISRFQQAQTLLQATLQSTSQMLRTSLLDYL